MTDDERTPLPLHPIPCTIQGVAAGQEGITQVVVTSGGGLRQEAWAGRHTLVADEPVSAGGGDAGPNPYELLLAALGACTSMTLSLYAGRKGWKLDGVEIRLSHRRVHAADCADCEQKEGYLDQIEKEITLSGDLDEVQLARLGEIAERCPVNRTLHQSVRTNQTVRLAGSAPAGDSSN